MGQDITVTKTPSADENTHIFSLNRTLTGMEIATFTSLDEIPNDRDPAHVLARRILKADVDSISIYSNVVTINCDKDKFAKIEEDITSIFENLFRYYGDDAGWAKEA